jgi:hypothetical protein
VPFLKNELTDGDGTRDDQVLLVDAWTDSATGCELSIDFPLGSGLGSDVLV